MRWLLALISHSFLGVITPRDDNDIPPIDIIPPDDNDIPPDVTPFSAQYRVACDAIDWTFEGGLPPYHVYAAQETKDGLYNSSTVRKLFETSSQTYHYMMPPTMANYTGVFQFEASDYYYKSNARTVVYPRPFDNCDGGIPFTSMTPGGRNTQTNEGVTTKTTGTVTSRPLVTYPGSLETLGVTTGRPSSTAAVEPLLPLPQVESAPRPTPTPTNEHISPPSTTNNAPPSSIDDLPSVSLVAETQVVTAVVSSGDDVQTITSMQSFYSTMTLVTSPTRSGEVDVRPVDSSVGHPPVVSNSGSREDPSVIRVSNGAGIIIGATAGAAVLVLIGFALYRYRISSWKRIKCLSEERLLQE